MVLVKHKEGGNKKQQRSLVKKLVSDNNFFSFNDRTLVYEVPCTSYIYTIWSFTLKFCTCNRAANLGLELTVNIELPGI